MNLTIEELPNSKIAFFRKVGEYGEVQNKELMESFKRWMQKNGLANHPTIYGIPQDNPELTLKEECRYDVGILVKNEENVAKPAQVGDFAGGKYAVFTLEHTKEAVHSFWETVFSKIEENNLTVSNKPIIERYTAELVHQHLCEILVPVQ
ncbi:GyrI-like domain-containing protein [Sporosarcina sp. Te-1]|uniref:AraC family transcriptional regulator n=1 Tax=Sporosarcina sp. Te-1 TaxID=2818390 RepID=UPI001A9CBEB6|nr:GyrI-like domain-containing protein [Sporosarcina sp. Te-1]QTD41909.1 GyrI-like domain-containing protein [Sporosarcina sp. Te-1]